MSILIIMESCAACLRVGRSYRISRLGMIYMMIIDTPFRANEL
ncbi:MAG TPA: hypothetical protein VFR78_20580 [Pyrinomonadaceae bacterium]|nr:hypothetical protein [Pyrinomonadaceae bacterium]